MEQIVEDAEEKVQAAEEAFEEEVEFIERAFGGVDEPIVYIRAGGELRAFRQSDLRFYADSVLGKIFLGGSWTMQERDLDEEGNYGMDVDPEHLDKILDLLRLGRFYGEGVSLTPLYATEATEKVMKDTVQRIAPTIAYLLPNHTPVVMRRMLGVDISNSRAVDDPTLQATLRGWWPDRDMTLVFNHGNIARMRQKCEGKAPAVCVLKTREGYVFGGYSSVGFDLTEEADPHAFIFFLKAPGVNAPLRFRVKDPADALSLSEDNGKPLYSTWGFADDLVFKMNENDSLDKRAYLQLGQNYECDGCGCLPELRELAVGKRWYFSYHGLEV